jgi:hypothetical protein
MDAFDVTSAMTTSDVFHIRRCIPYVASGENLCPAAELKLKLVADSAQFT